MSDDQDRHRRPSFRGVSNIFRRRQRPGTVDGETRVTEPKAKGWKKLRVPWKSKAVRAGTQGDKNSSSPSKLSPRDGGIPVVFNDSREGDVQPEQGIPPSTRSAQILPSNSSSNPNYAQDEVHSFTAVGEESDLRVVELPEVPAPSLAQEPNRSPLKLEEQPHILESEPHAALNLPLLTPRRRLDNPWPRSEHPLDGLPFPLTAVFPGVQNIAIETLNISVNTGGATRVVVENPFVQYVVKKRVGFRDEIRGAMWGAAAFGFFF
ncbi:hypothetical protein FA13DRAFT_1778942 [Coprinellus micaceus]|uniref:Uncharacterized protein n=1 Tax=Coprinellus micaceus TaxID=71717 RepID=A0A4Y7SK94_COPMI|nr:hypothetical protein FA13DRAFT_1778942 [Coprinellus micaceus]